MTQTYKKTLEEQLQEDYVNAHNSAIRNIAGVISAVRAEEERLKKMLEEIPEVLETLNVMATDPIAANDDPRLFELHRRFGSTPNSRG